MMKIIITLALKKFALIWPLFPDTNLYPKISLKICLQMNINMIGKTYENGKCPFTSNIAYQHVNFTPLLVMQST